MRNNNDIVHKIYVIYTSLTAEQYDSFKLDLLKSENREIFDKKVNDKYEWCINGRN